MRNLGPLRKVLFAEATQRGQQQKERQDALASKRGARLGADAPVRLQSQVRAAKRGKRNG
jgi:hypothetical protein